MIGLLIVALGAFVGALAAAVWFARRNSKWIVVASNSVVCTLMGAFAGIFPNPPSAITDFIAFGVLTTAATPIPLLTPLSDFGNFRDVCRAGRQLAAWLAIATLYCVVFAIVGYMAVRFAIK